MSTNQASPSLGKTRQRKRPPNSVKHNFETQSAAIFRHQQYTARLLLVPQRAAPQVAMMAASIKNYSVHSLRMFFRPEEANESESSRPKGPIRPYSWSKTSSQLPVLGNKGRRHGILSTVRSNSHQNQCSQETYLLNCATTYDLSLTPLFSPCRMQNLWCAD